ncbi:hypothetical protein LOZ55_001541 [Ophidiomyces ophidiicola]|nr:hypothetical protein LOZ55_001541 [Ophidiomyces ophidiicola]
MKYTDIDYYVFTDAARFVANGQSPYDRATYRYTPLLAWLLVPTAWGSHGPLGALWFLFGKALFALADIVAGWLIVLVLKKHQHMDTTRALKYASIWLLNPMVATISTRGSSEGLLGVMVIALLWAVLQKKVVLAGCLLGLGVHFKIYPFIYGPAILWYMDHTVDAEDTTDHPEEESSLFQRTLGLLTPNRLTLTFTALGTFAAFNVGMYLIYGLPFVQHTYLHHLTRVDHRHNYSPYNTLLYLSSSETANGASRSNFESLAFIPQLGLSAILIPLVLARKDLAGSLLAQTFAFVAFNKVCTSQYFLWYIIFLPLYLPYSSFVARPFLGGSAATLWVAGQVLWLRQGFKLEFLGISTFFPVRDSRRPFYFEGGLCVVPIDEFFVDAQRIGKAEMMLSAVTHSHLIAIDHFSKAPASTTLETCPSEPCTPFHQPQRFEITPESTTSFLSKPESIELDMSDMDNTPLQFEDLPIEIHEAVLDHLFGVRGAALTSVTTTSATASSWSKTLRHPRRKVLSDLALVSRTWRPLVQERIYRHIQVKGTTDGLQESAQWFSSHPHLGPYVRHIEVWVPVWGDRLPRPHILPQNRRATEERESQQQPTNSVALFQAVADGIEHGRTNHNFRFANRNATLQQIFFHVACFFPDAKMLTLEGGHCKKPPMIKHFCDDATNEQSLEPLPNIQIFIMRGAWNIMRGHSHWCTIAAALPNIREWNCTYAKPKREAQATISRILTNFPRGLTRLSISLEGFCSKTNSQSRWLGGPQVERHLCRLLGDIIPQLESLTFTGKVCATLFAAARAATIKREVRSRLKAVDLVVKACCCELAKPEGNLNFVNDHSGITNMTFIKSFEKLVVTAVRSLDTLTAIQFMRIRYIDLDSICGQLNPYYQLVGNDCTGLWSEEILETLQETRPNAQFDVLDEGILPEYSINSHTGTAAYPRSRPRSMRVSAYEIIADKSKP